MTKIMIGLVIGNIPEKYREKWVEDWYEQAIRIGNGIIIIDNSSSCRMGDCQKVSAIRAKILFYQ